MTNTCGTTFTDNDTIFWIKILETGWIKDVYLLLSTNIEDSIEKRNFGNIRLEKASHFSRENIGENTYSEFICITSFSNPTDYMEYCFFYSIDGKDFLTKPQHFIVKN